MPGFTKQYAEILVKRLENGEDADDIAIEEDVSADEILDLIYVVGFNVNHKTGSMEVGRKPQVKWFVYVHPNLIYVSRDSGWIYMGQHSNVATRQITTYPSRREFKIATNVFRVNDPRIYERLFKLCDSFTPKFHFKPMKVIRK
jgi:hypothetical protein